jgi:hypothetical protein
VARFDLGQVKDVIDQLKQVTAAGEHIAYIALLTLVEGTERMIFQQL